MGEIAETFVMIGRRHANAACVILSDGHYWHIIIDESTWQNHPQSRTLAYAHAQRTRAMLTRTSLKSQTSTELTLLFKVLV